MREPAADLLPPLGVAGRFERRNRCEMSEDNTKEWPIEPCKIGGSVRAGGRVR